MYAVVINPNTLLEGSGVPNTVKNLLQALSKLSKLRFFTWDNEFGGLRNFTASEAVLLNKLGIYLDGDELSQPNGFKFSIFCHSVSRIRDILILEPGVLIDNAYGIGTFRKMIFLSKSADLQVHVLLYDLIHLHFAPYSTEYRESYLRYLLDLYYADHVIAISNHVSKDFQLSLNKILNTQDNSGRLISVVHLAPNYLGSSVFQSKKENAPFVLLLGTIEPRKQQELVMEIFNEIMAENESLAYWKLKVVGNLHEKSSDSFIKLLSKSVNVDYLGSVNNSDLAILIDQSSFTIFASEDEGFGMPIVESLSRGKPCISANFGAMAEVSPFSSMKVDIRDKEKLKKKILDFMRFPEHLNLANTEAANYDSRSWDEVAFELVSKIVSKSDKNAHLASIPSNETIRTIFGSKIASTLTVVISTFNRLPQLRVNLEHLKTLKKSFDFDIFVLDNASTDGTQEFLSQLNYINWYSNPFNIGMIGNLMEIPKYVGTSHVWVIGDDDFITYDGMKHSLDVISNFPEIPLLVHNFEVFYSDTDFNWSTFSFSELMRFPICDSDDSFWSSIIDMASLHDNLFTAIYQFVWRQEVFFDAFVCFEKDSEFLNDWNSAPSAAYLTSKFAQGIGYWSGKIGVVANGANSWSGFRPRWHSVIVHQYIKNLRSFEFSKEKASVYSVTHQKLFLESLQEFDLNEINLITPEEYFDTIKLIYEDLECLLPDFQIELKKLVRPESFFN